MLKNVYDVIVIGSGPAGCKTAELAARLGLKVLLLEEHEKIGEPVKCTGLVSHRIVDLSGIDIKKILVNEVRKARFFTEKGEYLELESKKPVYVISRDKLDKHLAEKAIKSGVEIMLGSKFKDFLREKNLLIVNSTSGKYKCKLLVGADGPFSTVARAANIKQPEEYVIGYQETIKDNFIPDTVELWFGKNISPDFFGWVVPINEYWARVGIAAKTNVVKYFKNFIQRRFRLNYDRKDILGGIIRYGIIKTSVADNLILVGDAAAHVKPYSGGGIIYSLIAARYAALACKAAISKKRFDAYFLKKEYDKKWRVVLEPGIKRGLFLHKILHSFPDKFLSTSIKFLRPIRPILNNLDMDLLFIL